MIRTFNEQYPSLQEKQVDFRKALIGMVNARRYLESEGFKDIHREDDPAYWWLIEGSIFRSPGIKLDSKAFFQSKNKTKLLETIVSGDVYFIRPSFMNYHPDGGVVKSFLGKENYTIHLRVKDTTKSPNPLTWFSSAKRFGFYYKISLAKDLIENPDNEEFERYVKGLREASRRDVLSKEQDKILDNETPDQPSSFVNPWEIDIPKIENIVGGRER